MNETVAEWVSKAEGDWRVANREFRYPGETASRTFTESCLQVAAPLRDRLLKLVAAE